jgi:predicted enzyme related to lactoylglutathione lyase
MANPNNGRFNWHELMSSDIDKALAFYKSLFGWTTDAMDMGPMGTYYVLKAGDVGIGGAMKTPPGGPPSHWLTYVGSEDPDKTVAQIKEHGGKIIVPPTEVPNMVRFAIAMDPENAAFGVLKGLGPTANDPPYDGPPRVGHFVWDELYVKDPAAAAKFYGKIFGWTGKVGEGDPMQYWHWQNAGKDIGGMMKLPMPDVPPHWLGYVAVTDVDASHAKVSSLGGTTIMKPMDIEKVGKFSIEKDPTGAVFALFRSARV